ncbi:MAG: LPS-assembly protein LptD [Nitrospinota bacterium]
MPRTAQGTPAPRGVPPQILLPGEETRIRADSLSEDAERQLIIGQGFVDVQYMGNLLQADRVQINVETGEGVAEGNVVFQDKGNRLVCDRIEFNIRRQQAVLYGVQGELGRQYRISGERVERQDENSYRIQQGAISTCTDPIPEWQIRSRSMDVTLEEWAYIRQPMFWVAGFPVGFLPYFVAPVKTKRSTGFLVPTLGVSDRDGFKYDQEFFWAFSRYADATFGVEYRQKRGFISKAGLRYRLSLTTDGSADFKYLDDDLTEETFFRLRGEHRQEFGEKFRGFYRFEQVNNLDFDTSVEEDLDIRTRRDVESIVDVSKNWPNSSFQARAQFVDSAEETRKDYFQRAPDVTFSLSPSTRELGAIPISPAVSTSVVRFNAQRDARLDEIWRLDAAPRLSLPLTSLQWFTLTPFVEGRLTYYSRGREPMDPSRRTGGFSRELWSAGINAEGPRLFRTFSLGFENFPAIKHLTQLNIGYFFRPDIDVEDRRKIVEFDSLDSIERQHTLSYTWQNRFPAKIRTGRDVFESREVLSVSISNALDIRKLTEGEDRPLSEVTLRVESKPFRLWRIGIDTAYNIYDKEISSYGFSLDLRQGREWFLRDEVRFVDRKDGEEDELNHNFSAGVRFLKIFFLEGGARWTGEDSELLEKNIRFRYRGCCWGFTLEFLEREDETLFQFGFNLVGLIGDDDAPVFKFGRAVANE